MYESILYLLGVLPFGYKKYLTNKDISITIRILNLLISFFLFSYYLHLFRIHLWSVIGEGLSYLVPADSGSVVDSSVTIVIGIINIINAIILTSIGTSLGIVAKNSRHWFLDYSIIGWLIYSFNIYFINTIVDGVRLFSNLGELVFTIILLGIPLLLLRLFYTRPQTKLMLD